MNEASQNIQICTRCVYDSTIPDIHFDRNGVCKFCHIYDDLEQTHPLGEEGEQILQQRVALLKKQGRRRKYDCVVGVSGGTDSTYTIYQTIKLGLRPLAVHYDNGWNSEIATENIRKALDILGGDLFTVVEDWEEFKNIQLAYLKASTPDGDTPTDIGLKRALYKAAAKYGIKTVITGYTFRNEGVCPLHWTYMEGRYIVDVQKRFGDVPLRHYKNLLIRHILYYVFYKGIKTLHMLQYMNYLKSSAKAMLSEELQWTDYGGHHHENYYTKFWQSYVLPKKFGIDKRKREYSAAILSGQMTREEALAKLQAPYQYDMDLVEYTIKKLGISKSEFDEILARPPKSFMDYKTYYPLIKRLRWPIRLLCDADIFPKAFYLKYLT